MPTPPDNQEMVKASFAFWLMLLTNPTFAAYDPKSQHPVTPSAWDPDNLPENVQALDPDGKGVAQTILDYLANNNAADKQPYWVHFQAVQAAYQAVMNQTGPKSAKTAAGTAATYTTGDPTCPRIGDITSLTLNYSK